MGHDTSFIVESDGITEPVLSQAVQLHVKVATSRGKAEGASQEEGHFRQVRKQASEQSSEQASKRVQEISVRNNSDNTTLAGALQAHIAQLALMLDAFEQQRRKIAEQNQTILNYSQ